MPQPQQAIVQIADHKTSVTIHSDFSGTLTDKVRNIDWRMSPCCFQEYASLSQCAIWNRVDRCYMDRYPAFFHARNIDEGVHVTVKDQINQTMGELTCQITLDDGDVRFRIDHIDETLPSLIFPPYLESESLVIPRILGEWHRQPIPEGRFIMPASGWAMRWFGGLRGDAGWIGIVEEGYADSGVYLCGHSACAAWQKSLNRWQGPRSLRISFTGDGYVGQAKTFRAFAKQHGLFTSLRQKVEERPQLENLVGGRAISFFQAYTQHKFNKIINMRPVPPELAENDGKVQVIIPFRDVSTIIAEAKRAGMKKGYFNLRGWLKGGYDETHPDTWPCEPALGGFDELKTIMAEADPFVAMLHDNYQDIYRQSPSFPKYVQKDPQGKLKVGGTWHGGRCYLLNPEKALEYVQRNYHTFSKLNPRAAFLDTISGAHFQEDYSPEHTLTRARDAEGKLDIVRYHKQKGIMVGSEWGADFSVNDVDFVETRQNRAPFHSVPLWPLVYHDTTVTLRYKSGTADYQSADDLSDMLWGYAKLWAAGDLENFRSQIERFKQSMVVDKWHQRVGYEEMTRHDYLDPDGMVEKSQFESAAIVANFADEPYRFEGKEVPAKGHLILD